MKYQVEKDGVWVDVEWEAAWVDLMDWATYTSIAVRRVDEAGTVVHEFHPVG